MKLFWLGRISLFAHVDSLCRVFVFQGVILETGDVIRLGRVCYIVKETSIELGEQALKLVESYAE